MTPGFDFCTMFFALSAALGGIVAIWLQYGFPDEFYRSLRQKSRNLSYHRGQCTTSRSTS